MAGPIIEYTLQPGTELRFEVPAGATQPGKVRLVPCPGQFAEVNGAELAPGNWHEFPAGTAAAVYSWHGCRLRLSGVDTEMVYKATETPMPVYAQTHAFLERMRRNAKEGISAQGPRVLVCGPSDSGKTSVCRLLANYAARLDWDVTYVDLDVSNNSIAIPGTIAAVPVDAPVADEGFSTFPPISYFYGDTVVEGRNERLYDELTGALARDVAARVAGNEEAAQGGVIVR
eukprot:Hpha_TRINITY_DN27018_c0_g1::TRINITY_DN27018_c0_g1_i1::g.33186::m.33186/K14399/CLP1, HERB; polyribonucleotide 5'-hydroxyl-kinase